MKISTITINDIKYDLVSVNTVIVGTGAAGYNAADSLYDLGQKDICIVTEGLKMGTSRNTGSDNRPTISLHYLVMVMIQFTKWQRHYLTEAACMETSHLQKLLCQQKDFIKLASIGVPFPHNKYGEYVG
jgi:succinate dehydrogenase/fumarate reductase flavoprotein subunit